MAQGDKLPPFHEWPTLAELAARSNGFACPRCGCRDWRVSNTYVTKVDGFIRRRRICRNCNEPLATVEVPTDTFEE